MALWWPLPSFGLAVTLKVRETVPSTLKHTSSPARPQSVPDILMSVPGQSKEGREELKGRWGKSLLQGSRASSTLGPSACHRTSLGRHLACSFSPFRFQLRCHFLRKALPALRQPLLPSHSSFSVILPCLMFTITGNSIYYLFVHWLLVGIA